MTRFILGGILLLVHLGLPLGPPLWASEESADFNVLGPEGSAQSVMPLLQFSVEESLRKNVEFWIRVYTQHTTDQGLIHDSKYIDRVYEVLDFSHSNEKTGGVVKKAKKKWKDVLLSLHRKQNHSETFTQDEQHVFELFRDIQEPNKFLNAAHRKRLRFQLGQKNRFLDGLYQSGRYLSLMEAIFKQEGMPLELTRLPFVESSFNVKARSKVGASGIWQFMRSTGKLFIQVTEVIDERNDPIRATLAAARLLRLNFDSLKNWPLAVTAYNHGRKGMMRAVRRVGSEELEIVVAQYHQRSFGFASGNFFTELLAAIEVEKNALKYFGKTDRANPLDFIEVRLPDFIEVKELTRRMDLDFKAFRDLNPAFTEGVYSGHFLIPSGYPIRIPMPLLSLGVSKDLIVQGFWKNYTQIPPVYKLKAQRTLKYDSKGKSLGHPRKNRTSFPQGSGKHYALYE